MNSKILTGRLSLANKLGWDCVGAMVTTGGEVRVVDVYINGGGPTFGAVSLGLVDEAVFTGPSSVETEKGITHLDCNY